MICIIFGGSGEVGQAVTHELLKSDMISQVTMLGRRKIASLQDEPKVKQVVVDTSSPDFENIVKEKASMIFTSNDIIINSGVILAGILVNVLNSNKPDLLIGTIVFIIVIRGALNILKLSK